MKVCLDRTRWIKKNLLIEKALFKVNDLPDTTSAWKLHNSANDSVCIRRIYL